MVGEANEGVFSEEIQEPHETLNADVMKQAIRWIKVYWSDFRFSLGGGG